MKAAIIGSRNFADYTMMKSIISGFNISTIISGGAAGADTLAEKYSSEMNIPIEVIKPDWSKYGRGAGIVRNKEIVNNADIVFAFWDGTSKGTKSSINFAKKAGKQIEIISYLQK